MLEKKVGVRVKVTFLTDAHKRIKYNFKKKTVLMIVPLRKRGFISITLSLKNMRIFKIYPADCCF